MTSFYDTPAQLPTHPGQLIRHEPSAFQVTPLKLVRHGAASTRIMYSSINSRGTVIPVTGTVLTPAKAWAGRGERPVIGFAVGTQGMSRGCAPSRTLPRGRSYESLMIARLLSWGYTVVATDYEGLGTEGVHTYLDRVSQGHAVLDSLRAATQVPGAGVNARGPMALVGYSQGGAAIASAAELAHEYAPELPLAGAFAGAAPADLIETSKSLEGSANSEFLLFLLVGQFTAGGIDPVDHLNTRGLKVYAEAGGECVPGGLMSHPFVKVKSLTTAGQSLADLADTDQRVGDQLRAQLIGDGRAPRMPVVLSHSRLDDVVPYRVGRDLAERWRDSGARVTLHTTVAPLHLGGYLATVRPVKAFLKARFSEAQAGVRP